MPFVQVHSSRVVSRAAQRALGLALATAYAECMQTNHRIVNIGFVHYGEGELARYDTDDGEPQEMTIVTCDIRSGRPAAMQESLGRAMTSACSRGLDVAESRIAVYLTEHAAHQIYRDGGRAPEWSPAEGLAASARDT